MTISRVPSAFAIPFLAEHPYVRHVEALLGFEIARNGAPNRHGYSTGLSAR